MKLLKNKVALITGAGSGIGRAISLLYASEGAKVVVSDISEENGFETVNLIRDAGNEAIFVHADTSRPDDHQNLVEECIKQYHALHIAVNNAGIGGKIAPTGEYPIESWEQVIGINLSGVFYGLRYQIPAILAAGGGSIVNIASILGATGVRYSPAYVASKHGVVGLTKAAALEYADKNIRVNAIGPGYILTPLLTKNMTEELMAKLVELHPMGRLGEAEEIAELALWLNSEKASFVTGAYYNADGGYLAR